MIDANRIQQNPFVVSICGPSGAGKSQLAKATVRELGDHVAARVPVDFFFVPRPREMPLDLFLVQPLRYDWSLLGDRFACPCGAVTSTPDADFELFLRRANEGGQSFTIRPVMICDGMEPYPGSDLVVRLDAAPEVRWGRIAERDRRWGTRVHARLDHLEATWQVASRHISFAAVLDGTVSLATTVRVLASMIRERYPMTRTALSDG